MDAWLNSAIGYIDMWLEFQMRLSGQPGCTVAIGSGQNLVHEKSFGLADVSTGEALTPRHGFRVASHSKTFTAAGILKLREQGRVDLDDTVGLYVTGIHPSVASVTLSQLLTHGAGVSRDGENGGYFTNQRPFLSAPELLAALKQAPPIEAGSRPKYSNLGYGLLGLVIESVVGEPYDAWTTREIIEPAGLLETAPDVRPDGRPRLARGHTGRVPFGNRRIIPGDNPTFALAPATGFVSTAADLACFYAQLSPEASSSILSVASRQEMTHAHRPDRDAPVARAYGCGVVCGNVGPWNHFGHLGRFQGSITRTVVLPIVGVTVVVLTNAIDGPAPLWLEGIVHILRTFYEEGAPNPDVADWTGRWWTLSGAMDFVAAGSHVKSFSPSVQPPFAGASQISLTDRDRGHVTKAPAAERFGEAVSRSRNRSGTVTAIRVGGQDYLTEAAVLASVEK